MMAALVRARKKSGLTGEEVSERLGRARNFVHRVETGQRRLDANEFIDYCEACNVDPLDIMREIIAARRTELK